MMTTSTTGRIRSAGAAPRSPPSCDAAATYVLFHAETQLPNWGRAVLYAAALAYCFVGLSAITARFFKSMETIVKQTREVVVTVDDDDDDGPCSNNDVKKTKKKKKREEKVWNYAVADVALLAFGTSFPQISLAVVDAIRNLGQPTAGGLGPGTLVGSAAFDLFPIHAVCVVMPRAGSMKKISDLGVWLVELFWSFWAYIWLYIILEVWTPRVITLSEALLTVLQYGLLLLHAYAQDKRWPYVSIPLARGERPEDWVPEEEEEAAQDSWVVDDYDDEISETLLPLTADASSACSRVDQDSSSRVDIFVGHDPYDDTAACAEEYYHSIPEKDDDDVEGSSSSVTIMNGAAAVKKKKNTRDDDASSCWISIWRRQFVDAVTLESPASRKMDSAWLRFAKICGNLTMAPWRLAFALVPPHHVAHGWVAFACSLAFISTVAYGVTRLTDGISCVTGVSPYVIAFTALAAGTSWPDLVASKIAAERQVTADSALANITCSNSVNIYVGIGVPWLINTAYNYFFFVVDDDGRKEQQQMRVDNADGLSFSLLVYFATSFGCVAVLVARRVFLGAELGGPRVWAWATSAYFMLLWVVFVVLSSLRFSGVI